MQGRFSGFWIIAVLLITCSVHGGSPPIRVAVIGGGIGGCATSWLLRERLGTLVNVSLFEPGQTGGRVRAVEVDGHYYEAGASIAHAKNKIFQTFRERFGLEKLADDDEEGRSGLYDGERLVFESTGWFVLDAVKMVWRYGFSPFKLSYWITNYIDRFAKIYDLFDQNCSYLRPTDLIFAADPQLAEMFNISLEQYMRKHGFGEAFVKEVAGAAMRANYNQDVSVPAFVGSISMAGMEGPLFHVKGGNHQIPQKLCQAEPNIVRAFVSKISLLDTQRFRLSSSAISEDFDYVVVAAPMDRHGSADKKIVYEGFPPYFKPSNWEGGFRRTVATFVQGQFNSTIYGSSVPLDQVIVLDLNDVVGSVSKLVDVYGNATGRTKSSVWKIFSNEPLTNEKLDILFPHSDVAPRNIVNVVDWRAYPDYLDAPERPPPFGLFNKLFYLNAIEWMGSAMEMSLIAAQNIAIGIENDILERQPFCPVNENSQEKTEL